MKIYELKDNDRGGHCFVVAESIIKALELYRAHNGWLPDNVRNIEDDVQVIIQEVE